MRTNGKKRNAKNQRYNTNGYIRLYFKDEIDLILASNSNSFRNLPDPYVHHEEAEQELAKLLEYDELKNKVFWFTGLTGSGKSTILQHSLGYSSETNGPVIKNGTLVIPVDFNRAQGRAKEALLSSLRGGVRKICMDYNIDFPFVDNREFYDYVCERRQEVILRDPEIKSTATPEEQFHDFIRNVEEGFTSFQLQYVLDKINGEIKLVVLAIDNVEAYMRGENNEEKFVEPLLVAFKLNDCINKLNHSLWGFNLIISCRHYIYRIAKSKYAELSKNSNELESFSYDNIYDLANPVRMNDLVNKRDEVITPKYKDKDKWEQAVKTVRAILHRMDDRIGDFVLELNLKDIRKSMNTMKDMVLNRRLQYENPKDEITPGSFNIESSSQFNLSRVNLIKTIGLDGGTYYCNDGLIPNLFYNEISEGLEMYPLLTLKYFLKRCDYRETGWEESINIPEFYYNMKEVFNFTDDEINGTFRKCVEYFIKHRILLRSADQSQDDVVLSQEEIRKIDKVYVPGMAICLWNELALSGALFQLFMDDVWLDPTGDFFGDDEFSIEQCYEYLRQLWTWEERIYNQAANYGENNIRKYLEAFDSDTICKQLIKGLIESATAIRKKEGDSAAKGREAIAVLAQLGPMKTRLEQIENVRNTILK